MSPHTVRVNTFVKENKTLQVDPVSYMFILLQVMFGLGRMPLIGKDKLIFVFITIVIFMTVNGTILYFALLTLYHTAPIWMQMATVTRNIIITILSFLRCKWLQRYYSELNNFDTQASCKPAVPKWSVWIAAQAGLVCIFIVLIFEVPMMFGLLSTCPHYLIPVHIVYALEVCYFGHLLNLLTPRLKLINYYMESSLTSARLGAGALQKLFIFYKCYDANLPQCQMHKLMDLYLSVVEAYDFLIEGIKWQLVVFIISAFETVLGFLYAYALNALRTGEMLSGGAVLQLGVTLVIMVPLFAPCTSSDRVHAELRLLRELLASRLYENNLDKSERSVARALVAFTETRDLSLRLLRVLDIDISLPFKFMGLLLTYLIILLQFEKVIHP